MSANTFTLTALLLGGIAAIFTCAYLVRPDIDSNVATTQSVQTSVPRTSMQQDVSQTISAVTQASSSQASLTADEQVAKWIIEAFDANPAVRATAINGLATASPAAVVPTLQRVLIGGEPLVDRPLALNALRKLALQQGDRDGGVRDAIRQAIYDGSDAEIAQSAQVVLDEVEATLAQHAKS